MQISNAETKLYFDAIGESADGDYNLLPKEHASTLPSNAGPLARILQKPELQKICNDYDEADTQANRAQWKYKFWAKLAIWLVFVAIVTSSFSTALPLKDIFHSEIAEFYLRLVAIAFLLLTLFLAFGIMLWMELATPYEKWNKARGEAEYNRKELFRAVFAAAPTGAAVAGELKILPLKLEYFRRYLLGDQMTYYEERAGDYKKSERLTKILWAFATLAVFAILAVTLLIGVLSPSSEQGASLNLLPSFTGWLQDFEVAHLDRYILAGGITLAALFGAKLATSLLDKAKGNAIRFSFTHANLETLEKDGLEQVRQDALDGNEDAVDAFVNRIMAQISVEHQDWVKLQSVKPAPPTGAVAVTATPAPAE